MLEMSTLKPQNIARAAEPTLTQLFSEHEGNVSDKWSSYLTTYDRLFGEFRLEKIRLLEIGIQNGGSLEVWGKYFPRTELVVGLDCDENCKNIGFDDKRISIVVADANTPAAVELISKISSTFQIIIDDASHTSSDIVRTFALFFKAVSDGGLYVIEDLHCSYWNTFQGGLYQPYSSQAFFKLLVDVINSEHWGIPLSRKEYLAAFASEYSIEFDEAALSSIHSVEFSNSMCVIRKRSPEQNLLNKREISGRTATVNSAVLSLDTAPSKPNEGTNRWSQGMNNPAVRVELMEMELHDARRQVFQLSEDLRWKQNELDECGRKIRSMTSSLSWRLSAPMRALGRLVGAG